MINSRLARGLVAVLCFTALVVLSLYTVGRLATDSTVGTTARAAVGGLLAGTTLGLFRYRTGLVRAWRRRSGVET